MQLLAVAVGVISGSDSVCVRYSKTDEYSELCACSHCSVLHCNVMAYTEPHATNSCGRVHVTHSAYVFAWNWLKRCEKLCTLHSIFDTNASYL
jgi:hypothetical protein